MTLMRLCSIIANFIPIITGNTTIHLYSSLRVRNKAEYKYGRIAVGFI